MKASINNRQNIKCGLSQNKSINCSVQNETIMQGGMNEAENISAGTTQRGLQGIPGEAATIQLGTVATGEPGTDVIITNSGTENAAIFNFTIPEGQTGATGYSPSASVSKVGNTATITITDKDGTTTAEIYDGAAGVTDVEVNGVSVVTDGVAEVTVPTKTSQLNNDSNFATVSQIPTDNTELTNGAGYITSSSLPTVNDATLTIQKNGTTVNTFTANSSTNTTVNITVPTDTSDLTNGADFVNSTDMTTALAAKQDLLTSDNAGTDISITTGGGISTIVESGTDSVELSNANSLNYVKLFGGCQLSGTPTPTTPVDIVSNNGVIKVNSQGQIYADGTVETVEVDTTGDTATAEMLLKVGDYQDEQEILSGAITRKVGVRVLDGTEDWKKSITNAFYLSNTIIDYLKTPFIPFCTHFKGQMSTPSGSTQVNDLNICFYAGLNFNEFYIRYNAITTAEQFKQYLANQYANGTPVILVYALATPTTETVTSQPLTIQAGTNTIEITQASLSNLPLEVSYEAGSGATLISFNNNSGYVLSSSLATVATTGDYDDLINKPYIPSGVVVDQVFDGTSTNAQSGVAIAGELNTRFTDNATKTWVSNNYGNLEAVNNGILWESTSSPTLYQWTTAIYTLSNTPNVSDIVYKINLGTNTAYPYSTVTAYYPSSSPLPSITIDADNNTHYEDGTTSGVSVEQKLVTSKQGVNADLILPYADKQATQTALSGKADTTLSNVSSIDAGSAVKTALDNKADIDLANVNDNGTIRGAGWAMPSNTYDTLTWGATSTVYTAPANGWFYAQERAKGTGVHYVMLQAKTANGGIAMRAANYNPTSTAQFTNFVCLPAKKGDEVHLGYAITSGQTMDANIIRFIYAQGSESEAS